MTAAGLARVHHLADLVPVGESAVRVTGRTGDREKDWVLAHKLARSLHERTTGVSASAVPTYESVLVEFDASVTDLERVLDDLEASIQDLDVDGPLHQRPRHFQVPVLYGTQDPSDPFGPDMGRVMETTGLALPEIVARHSEPTYVIRCLGAPGGSPMVYGPDLGVPVPRLTSPRASVPQGAVSLAGFQATITPTTAPGGWSVIGRTPLRLLELTGDSLVPYRPGDTLRFFPIGTEEFHRREGERMIAGAAA